MWKLTFGRAHLAHASLAIALHANTVPLMSTEQIFSFDAQTFSVITACWCVFPVPRGWRGRQLLHMLYLSLQTLMEMM